MIDSNQEGMKLYTKFVEQEKNLDMDKVGASIGNAG